MVHPHPAYNPDVKSVCFKNLSTFGQQFEVFHLAGHVTARCTPGLPKAVLFKGVRGADGLDQICGDLMLDDTTQAHVHMAVFTSFLGIRLQTTEWCYLENRVYDEYGPFKGGWMRVEPRLLDQCNLIRLSVVDFKRLLPSRPDIHPISNDLVITSRGSLTLRYTWSAAHWTAETEREMLRVCNEIADAIVNATS
jgi:hypothetical protein